MTKNITTLLAAACLSISSLQAQDSKNGNVHIGLMYPVSTNGVHAGDYTNIFSIHAIAGVSGNEKAFCASGVGNVVFYDANGLAAAGFINYIGNDANGAQLAGFINCVGNNASGLQAAGFTNINKGNVDGVQVAGFYNHAQNADAQIGGFINTAADVDGAQVAGFINIADDAPVQVAGFANIADEVTTQIGGFVNIAREVKGVQLAGFINIADKSDNPIGFINLIKNGEKSIGATIDDNFTTLVTFRSGGRNFYGIIGAGSNLRYSRAMCALEVGIGAHIPVARGLRINIEAASTSITDFWNEANFKYATRVYPALMIGRMEIFAGPSVNFTQLDRRSSMENDMHFLWSSSRWSDGTYGISLGGVAGVQFHF